VDDRHQSSVAWLVAVCSDLLDGFVELDGFVVWAAELDESVVWAAELAGFVSLAGLAAVSVWASEWVDCRLAEAVLGEFHSVDYRAEPVECLVGLAPGVFRFPVDCPGYQGDFPAFLVGCPGYRACCPEYLVDFPAFLAGCLEYLVGCLGCRADCLDNPAEFLAWCRPGGGRCMEAGS
jgi:hypothetical protein